MVVKDRDSKPEFSKVIKDKTPKFGELKKKGELDTNLEGIKKISAAQRANIRGNVSSYSQQSCTSSSASSTGSGGFKQREVQQKQNCNAQSKSNILFETNVSCSTIDITAPRNHIFKNRCAELEFSTRMRNKRSSTFEIEWILSVPLGRQPSFSSHSYRRATNNFSESIVQDKMLGYNLSSPIIDIQPKRANSTRDHDEITSTSTNGDASMEDRDIQHSSQEDAADLSLVHAKYSSQHIESLNQNGTENMAITIRRSKRKMKQRNRDQMP